MTEVNNQKERKNILSGNFAEDIVKLGVHFNIWTDESAEPEKKPMSNDEAYCMTCKKAKPFFPVVHRATPNGARHIQGRCTLGHKVSRFMSAEDYQEVLREMNDVSSRERSRRGGSMFRRQDAQASGRAPRPRALRQGDVVESTVRKDGNVKVNGNVIPVHADSELSAGDRVRGYFLGSFVRAIA